MSVSEQTAPGIEGTSDLSGIELSLVQRGVGYCVQRWLRLRLPLIPGHGMGSARRAIIFAAFSGLPLVIWAELSGRAQNATDGGTLLA